MLLSSLISPSRTALVTASIRFIAPNSSSAPFSASRRRRAGLAALEGLFRWLPPEAMLGITYRLLSGPDLPPQMKEVLPLIMRHTIPDAAAEAKK